MCPVVDAALGLTQLDGIDDRNLPIDLSDRARFWLGEDHGSPYFVTDFDQEEGDEGTPETDARLDQVLREPGETVIYEYDFGDGWTHTLILEQVGPLPDPATGEPSATGACPPEEVGGTPGYQEVADWVRGGEDPRHRFGNGLTPQEMRAWLPTSDAGWRGPSQAGCPEPARARRPSRPGPIVRAHRVRTTQTIAPRPDCRRRDPA